jgi:glycosyltransferase involved in cell wall biosynthesis
VESLLHSTLRPFEVVLVDNGSTDETPALFDGWQKSAEASGIAVQRLRRDSNTGAIDGRNAGMERMRGRYWVFLDNDAVVRSRAWLEST